MSRDTNALRELYVDVTGGETITEPQEDGPSYDPLGEAEMEVEQAVWAAAQQDGLTDAVE